MATGEPRVDGSGLEEVTVVALRSTRQDRALLIAVWVLTVAVLVLGGIAKSPILLVWGTVGLIAAIFLSRIHFRDTRGSGTSTPPDADPDAGASRVGSTPEAADTDKEHS